jgi:hypothetical protein
MSQPDHLAMTESNVLYASDPTWGAGTGWIWRTDADGRVTLAADGSGRPAGY